MAIVNWKDILDFWFDPDHIPLHFAENDDFDKEIYNTFFTTWEAGAEGLLVHWRDNVRGRLAEIIVLDQFSRNLWRNDIRTYTQDKMAIVLAQEAVNHPDYNTLSKEEKKFILLPFMHSESLKLHDWANEYFNALEDENFMFFEGLHRAVLEEFGRYPYQNKDLGRESTPDELKILEEKKDGFYSPQNNA